MTLSTLLVLVLRPSSLLPFLQFLGLPSCLDFWFPSLGLLPHTPGQPPPPYTHSSWGFSFFAISKRENADKVDSCCHGNHSPNYCVQPGSLRLQERRLGER